MYSPQIHVEALTLTMRVFGGWVLGERLGLEEVMKRTGLASLYKDEETRLCLPHEDTARQLSASHRGVLTTD